MRRATYSEGSARILVSSAGAFSWSKMTSKKIYIIVKSEDGTVTSNRLAFTRR
jgi:hypothetical protein